MIKVSSIPAVLTSNSRQSVETELTAAWQNKKYSLFPLDGQNRQIFNMRSGSMGFPFFSGATYTFGKKCFQNLNL